MRSPVSAADYSRQLAGFKQSAWRFEHQPSYDVAYEQQGFRDFLAGDPTPPTDNSSLSSWLAQVALHVSAGKTVGRLRVVDEPPTDYQRWMMWMCRWNRESGEVIDHLTRGEALAAGLPAVGDEDWWLLDDTRLLVTRYDQGRPLRSELVDDEPDVERARKWRADALHAVRQRRDLPRLDRATRNIGSPRIDP